MTALEAEWPPASAAVPEAMKLLAELRNSRPLLLYGEEWIEEIDKVLSGGPSA